MEDAAGIELDEKVIDKHACVTFFSYNGPVPLPLNRAKIGGPLVKFCPHNIREGFHVLYALAKSVNVKNRSTVYLDTVRIWISASSTWNVEPTSRIIVGMESQQEVAVDIRITPLLGDDRPGYGEYEIVIGAQAGRGEPLVGATRKSVTISVQPASE